MLKQFGQQGGGFGSNAPDSGVSESHYPSIVQLVMEQTTPRARWVPDAGEGGNAVLYGQYLVVTQTYHAHEAIENLFRQLRTMIKSGGRPRVKAMVYDRPTRPGGGQGSSAGGGFFSITGE